MCLGVQGSDEAEDTGGLSAFGSACSWYYLESCLGIQGSDEAEDAEDIGALAAFGCLRALSTVLDSVSRLPQLFPQLEDILFPIMQAMCSEDGQDVFEEILEIISYFTYFPPEVMGSSGSAFVLPAAALYLGSCTKPGAAVHVCVL